MRTAAKTSLVLCVIGVAVHLVLVLARTQSPSFVDLPIYFYFAGPYVIVGVLSWWRRRRPWISRLLLTIAILVSLSGIVAAAQYGGVESVGPFIVAFAQWIVLGGLLMILTRTADRHRKQAASNRDIACSFLDAFCRGDIEGIEALLAGTCRVQGPLSTWDNRDLYIAALRKDPPAKCRHRVLSVTESEDEVSVYYELKRPGETVTIAQLFRLRDQLIVGMLLVFAVEQAELVSA